MHIYTVYECIIPNIKFQFDLFESLEITSININCYATTPQETALNRVYCSNDFIEAKQKY